MNKYQKEILKEVKKEFREPFPFGVIGLDISFYKVRKFVKIRRKYEEKKIKI